MNFLTRSKFYFLYLFYVLFNLFNAIITVILYIILLPFCIANTETMIDVMGKINKHVAKLSADDESLILLKELLNDYRIDVMIHTPNNFDMYSDDYYRWSVTETMKYLKNHKIKIEGVK